jgi:hypothetical protein
MCYKSYTVINPKWPDPMDAELNKFAKSHPNELSDLFDDVESYLNCAPLASLLATAGPGIADLMLVPTRSLLRSHPGLAMVLRIRHTPATVEFVGIEGQYGGSTENRQWLALQAKHARDLP